MCACHCSRYAEPSSVIPRAPGPWRQTSRSVPVWTGSLNAKVDGWVEGASAKARPSNTFCFAQDRQDKQVDLLPAGLEASTISDSRTTGKSGPLAARVDSSQPVEGLSF